MNKKNLSLLTLAGSAVLLGGCINQGTPATDTQNPSGGSPDGTSEQQVLGTPTPSQMIGKEVTAQTTYQSPAGTESVGFTLIVDDTGTIASAAAIVKAINPTSKMRQDSFASSFPQAVMGKKLLDLTTIDRVGGSSLTTKAFNGALKDLQAQASM